MLPRVRVLSYTIPIAYRPLRPRSFPCPVSHYIELDRLSLIFAQPTNPLKKKYTCHIKRIKRNV